jgi:hypothetical protein
MPQAQLCPPFRPASLARASPGWKLPPLTWPPLDAASRCNAIFCQFKFIDQAQELKSEENDFNARKLKRSIGVSETRVA